MEFSPSGGWFNFAVSQKRRGKNQFRAKTKPTSIETGPEMRNGLAEAVAH